MRKCKRCNIEMITSEKMDFHTQGDVIAANQFIIKQDKGVFYKPKFSQRPKTAICPECGSIELYIDGENLEKIKKLLNYTTSKKNY